MRGSVITRCGSRGVCARDAARARRRASATQPPIRGSRRRSVGRVLAIGDYIGAAGRVSCGVCARPARAELICNVGVAYQKAHELPRAQRFLAECIRRGTALDEKFMAAVHTAVAAIDGDLRTGSFTAVNIVVEPEGASVTLSDFGDAERLVGSQLVWLPFGSHELVAKLDGYRTETRTIAIPDKTTVEVTLHRTRECFRRAAAVDHVDAAADPRPGGAPRSRESSARRSTVGAFSITGVARVLATIGTYLVARHDIDGVDTTGMRSTYDSESATANHWTTAYEVTAIATGVAAIVTGYLWYATRTPPTVELGIAPTPGGATTMLTGRF